MSKLRREVIKLLRWVLEYLEPEPPEVPIMYPVYPEDEEPERDPEMAIHAPISAPKKVREPFELRSLNRTLKE